jgi:hypothetical protein
MSSCGLVMEAAFHFNYNNPKLQGVQDFVHSHLVNHDAWQNLRFWERSFYGHYPLSPNRTRVSCVSLCVRWCVCRGMGVCRVVLTIFWWVKRQTR